MCLGHKVQKCKTERFSSKETDLLVREVKSAKTSKKHLRRVYDRAHGLQDVSAIFGHWQEWQLHFSTLEESEGASFIFFFTVFGMHSHQQITELEQIKLDSL